MTNYPTGEIVEGESGKLYGTCYNGGSSGTGCIYKINLNNNTSSVVYSFTVASTGSPGNGLIKASNGKFYGTTINGGANSKGAIYSFNPANNHFDSIRAFDGTYGQNFGNNKLFQASNGKIYGLNGKGAYGGLFELNPINNQMTNKKTFNNLFNGSSTIISGITESSTNKLMFALYSGRKYGNNNPNNGSIMEFNLSNNQLTEIALFEGANAGKNPFGTLAKGSNGNYYIHTRYEGTGGYGTLTELDYTNKSLKSVYDFAASKNGVRPIKKLISGPNGKLFGIANLGGAGVGVIYSLDPQNNDVYKVEQEIPLGVGNNFTKGFAIAPNGSFYACTGMGDGSIYNRGTVIKYNPTSSSVTKIGTFYSFNGYAASSALTLGDDNHLYGVANLGGDHGQGFIFRINTQIDTLQNVKSFRTTGPNRAQGNLLALSNGSFLGTTYSGGNHGRGVVYEYLPAEDSIYIHVHLHDTMGYGTESGFVQAENGKYYSFFQGLNTHASYKGGTLVEFDYATKKLAIKNGRSIYRGSRFFSPRQEDFISLSNNRIIGIVPGTGNNKPSYLATYDIDQDTLEIRYEFTASASGVILVRRQQASSLRTKLQAKEVQLYPNPASKYVKIAMDPQRIFEVSVTNLMGKRVAVSISSNELEVGSLEAGVYLVSVEDVQHQIQIIKLLVQ